MERTIKDMRLFFDNIHKLLQEREINLRSQLEAAFEENTNKLREYKNRLIVKAENINELCVETAKILQAENIEVLSEMKNFLKLRQGSLMGEIDKQDVTLSLLDFDPNSENGLLISEIKNLVKINYNQGVNRQAGNQNNVNNNQQAKFTKYLPVNNMLPHYGKLSKKDQSQE